MKKAALFILFLFCFSSCEQQWFQPGYLVFEVLTRPSIAIEKVDKDGKTSKVTEKMTISFEEISINGGESKSKFYLFQEGDNIYKTKLRSFEEKRHGHICICTREDGKIFQVTYIGDKVETGVPNIVVYFYVTEPVATEKELKNAVKYKYHTL